MSTGPLRFPWSSRRSYPPAPDGVTIYAVGDIHGRLDLLEHLHRAIDDDRAASNVGRNAEIYLGDYIDRGPHSARVVSRLMARARDVATIFLRGNHEQMLLDFMGGKNCLEDWKAVGGVATLLSYGLEPALLSGRSGHDAVRKALGDRLPEDHMLFYHDTGSYCCVGPYLMVHAGIRPGIALEEQTVSDLLEIRQTFLQFTGDFGYIVVHGHTPVAAPDLRPNRINIDTGAFATNLLTCLRIGQEGVRILGA